MTAFQSFLAALGWSLLDSVWQMAVVWTAYYLLTGGNKRLSAAWKHNLALVFVAIGTGWYLFSFLHLLNEPADPIVTGFIPVSNAANNCIPYLGGIYLLILMARFLNDSFQYFPRRNNKNGVSISPALQSFADRMAFQLGISKGVHVYLCDRAETAQTSGFLKPFILLPVVLLTRLSTQQVEAILVHELFHIRRNDYLVNIFMSCYQSIFFFNPFARLFYKAIAQERELACDDGVLQMNYAPDLYAEALFGLEKFRQVRKGFSIAADGHKPWLLMERIRRVVGKPVTQKRHFNPILLLSLVLAAGLFGIQQKAFTVTGPVQVTGKPVAFIPVYYEMMQEKIKTSEIAHTSLTHHQPVKKKTARNIPVPAFPKVEPFEDENPSDQVYFAENNIIRNFSNQQTIDLNPDPIHTFPGTPYVPSVSLSYNTLPEIIVAVSVKADLKRLETELEKTREQLKEMELKNQNLILLHDSNIQSFLEKIHHLIEVRKAEIDQLRIRLPDSPAAEIIHI